MAERSQPQPQPPPPPPLPTDQNDRTPNFTYVIQVPKDQVYRIPPPENALVIEQHRKPAKKNSKRSCCSCFLCVLVCIVIVLIAFAVVVGGIFSALLRPKSPTFLVQSILLKSTQPQPKNPTPDYDIKLEAHNPNLRVGISYQGGLTYLSLSQTEIASGPFATFYQGHKSAKNFGLVLKGSNFALPKEIESSIKNDKTRTQVTLSLTMNIETQMKMGLLRSETIKYDVACLVTVDTLAKGSRVLNQSCGTKRN